MASGDEAEAAMVRRQRKVGEAVHTNKVEAKGKTGEKLPVMKGAAVMAADRYEEITRYGGGLKHKGRL